VVAGFDSSAFDNTPFAGRVAKPWGYELLFTPPEKPYAGKLLHVHAGRRLSLQYHDEKRETIMLLRGRAQLLADDASGDLQTIEMQTGVGYSNVPGQRHRLVAIEDCDFIEASTPESGTTYRLEDDANRGHESPELRAAPNRGWDR
jgi:oxalate decarboxylase/phosphoglucose isomerase-like protein (cupin superfamily)